MTMKTACCLAAIGIVAGVSNQISHVSANGVTSAAPHKAAKVGSDGPVDAKQFRLNLTYHGESTKPYYNLILSVPPVAVKNNPFSLFVPISEEQGAKIIKHLKTSEFFKHAQVTDNQDDPKTGPQYLLRVRHDNKHFQESLGWDVGTVIRLDGIRQTLDGDAAKLMDRLLARLEGQRKVWESGEVVNGLKSTLSAEKKSFAAGRPIPIKLELSNVGVQDRQYWQRPVIVNGSEIIVTDEHGRRVPFRGVDAGTQTLQVTIKPAETTVIEACDLSSYYYLRRPGRYTVAFRAGGLPPSNSLRFEVLPDAAAAADGDPMGRLLLLELNSAKWSLKGSPNASAKVRPGCDREAVPGWQFVFIDPGTGTKGSRNSISFWLTDKTADVQMQPLPENESVQPSEYLGKVSRWHVYFQASAKALAAWPTVKEDITKALADAPTLSFKITMDRKTFAAGEEIPFAITLHNPGSQDIHVPEVYWSARLVLDGKEYTRLPGATSKWRGPGIMRPRGEFHIGGDGPPTPGIIYMQPAPLLSQYGIGPLPAGEHQLALQIGDDKSNELAFAIRPGTSQPQAGTQPIEPPIGRLGSRIGTYLTIEGIRAETFKSGIHTLLVDTVGGNKLDKPVGIWIDNVELPAGERCVLKGYETGRWIGTPNDVLRKTAKPAPQTSWQFQFYFVATSVEQPKTVKIK